MKASELRIGNYVRMEETDKHKGGFYEVSYLDSTKNNGCDDKVLPISLTVIWLLKFGFRQDKYKRGKVNWWNMPKESFYKAHHLMQMQNAWTWFIDFDDCTEGNDCHIVKGFHYVHQLQNLYFALTGKELTIKKKKTEKTDYDESQLLSNPEGENTIKLKYLRMEMKVLSNFLKDIWMNLKINFIKSTKTINQKSNETNSWD